MIIILLSRNLIDVLPHVLSLLAMGVAMIVGETNQPSHRNLDNMDVAMGRVRIQTGRGPTHLGNLIEILDGVGQTNLLYNEEIFILIISSNLVLWLVAVCVGLGKLY